MKERRKIRIAIANQHLMYCHAYTALLEAYKEYETVFHTTKWHGLVNKVLTNEIDLLILDIRLNGGTCYTYLKTIQKRCPHLKLLVITDCHNLYSIEFMIKYGIKGILKADTDLDELPVAIKEVCSGNFYYNKLMKKSMVKSILHSKKRLLEFDKEELQFIQHAGKDLNYSQIAEKMNLSYRTIDLYREKVFKKIGVKSRVGLFLFSFNNGF